MSKDNLKSLSYFLMVVALGFIPMLSKNLHNAREVFSVQSEQAQEMYTGELGLVYSPLDRAYVVTDELRILKEKEAWLNFSRFKVWPVISIWATKEDLYDKDRGILANPAKKGRLWERASYVTYYRGGNKVFEAYAGLRMHGGISRFSKGREKSLRLHFRNSYGTAEFYPNQNISIAKNSPVKRLVLHRDQTHRFVANLAFSIVNEIGGIAPRIQPVVVYLNGDFFGYQYMTEQVSEEQLKNYIGHTNFISYKLKGDNDNQSSIFYQKLITWIKYAPAPIDMQEVAKIFDIDNFTANILGIIYTGTTDWVQGMLIKDLEGKNKRWQIVTWDMDRAFFPYKDQNPAREFNWQIYGPELLTESNGRALRARLFRRLINESPEYREYFTEKVDELFSEKLTEKFFAEKFSEFDTYIEDAGAVAKENFEDVDKLKNFVKYRQQVLCKKFVEQLKLKNLKSCK